MISRLGGLQEHGEGVSQAGAGEIGEEGQEFPAAAPQHHDVQGMAKGSPPFGKAPASLHRRIHLPLQPTQDEGGYLRDPPKKDGRKAATHL